MADYLPPASSLRTTSINPGIGASSVSVVPVPVLEPIEYGYGYGGGFGFGRRYGYFGRPTKTMYIISLAIFLFFLIGFIAVFIVVSLSFTSTWNTKQEQVDHMQNKPQDFLKNHSINWDKPSLHF